MSVRVRTCLDGVIGGIIGAAIVAVLFMFIDTVKSLPLYTPTVLGTGLFVGAEDLAAPKQPQFSLKLTLMYTGVHGLTFIVLGVLGAQFVFLTKNKLNLGLSILLLFLILELGFIVTWYLIATPVLDQLDWALVLLGNLLAAIGMAIYLHLRNPSASARPLQPD